MKAKILFIFLILLSFIVNSFDPQEDIILRNKYGIYNGTNMTGNGTITWIGTVNATTFFGDGSGLTGIISVSNASKGGSSPYILDNGTNHSLDESVLNATIDARQTGGGSQWSINAPWLYNNSGNLDWNESRGNLTWAPISLVSTQSNDNTTQANQISNLNASVGTGGNINDTDIRVHNLSVTSNATLVDFSYEREYINSTVNFRHTIIDSEVYAIWQ